MLFQQVVNRAERDRMSYRFLEGQMNLFDFYNLACFTPLKESLEKRFLLLITHISIPMIVTLLYNRCYALFLIPPHNEVYTALVQSDIGTGFITPQAVYRLKFQRH